MKKILTIAAVALFMMTSCSDDDTNTTNENPGENVVLLRKSIENFDGEQFISTFTYEGNKLVRISESSSDPTSMEFFYTGDLLTSSKYHDGIESEDHTYIYNADKTLKTHIILVEDYGGSRYEYTYNANGTITVKHYVGDLESQTQLNDTSVITMNGDNIVSVVNEMYDSSYTFDTKNHPLKNIACFKTIMLSELEGGANNILTASYDNGDGIQTSTFTYTYNDANYPVTAKEVMSYDNQEDINTAQYFYE